MCWFSPVAIKAQTSNLSTNASFKVLGDTVGYAPYTIQLQNTSDTLCRTFQWLVNGKPTILWGMNELLLSDTGVYHIRLIGSATLYDTLLDSFIYCVDTFPNFKEQPVKITVLEPNGIVGGNTINDFSISHLPGMVLIESKEIAKQVRLLDLQGRQVAETNGNRLTLPILPQGVYLIQAEFRNSTRRQKWIML